MSSLQLQTRQSLNTLRTWLSSALTVCVCVTLAGVSALQALTASTTQCPDPRHPGTGTCTMHASSVDLSVPLSALGNTGPPSRPIFVPTPNHDHVVDNSRVDTTPIWWEVRPVLILDQSDWPAADGSSGITSSKAMDDAEAAGRAIEVGSNFFLFFSSKLDSMSGMTSK